MTQQPLRPSATPVIAAARAIGLAWLVFILALASASAAPPTPPRFVDPPALAEDVASGRLPPVEKRLPRNPKIVEVKSEAGGPPRHGGTLYTLMASAKETRQLVVYGYARLVGYDERLELVPDILAGIEVREGRIFTLRLREGHRWSDGHPFTAEDFRYYWDDILGNTDLTPLGAPVALLVDGEMPVFEVLNATTVRYTWKKPNPAFLPALAAPNPLYIYRPAHYLKQFHARYADPERLERRVAEARQRNWQALHNKMDSPYKNDNPDLPVLGPWVLTTAPPADRFVFVRNPFYYRVDTRGRQLPYIDKIVMNIAAGDLIAAKTAVGESDLQARYLRFDNIPFLKQNEEGQDFEVRLWRTGKGAHLALYPNLNVNDPVWRALFRDVRFRRALSLAIHREEINKVLYYGLALTGNNFLLPASPLYEEALRQRWAEYDLPRANAMLDELGLKRGGDGIRRLPDGRRAEIIVETAGESTEETDALQLVHDSWLKAGIKLYTRPLQREVFRNRIFAGSTQMAIWSGLENGLATAEMSPAEFAPTSQQQLQWPKWGQYYETRGMSGEPVDLPEAAALMDLYRTWRGAGSKAEKERIWREMLRIWADQVYSIGLIGGVLQPVVVSDRLKGVPQEGFYNWDPGAHFGIYRPDSFWLTADRGS